MRSDSPFAYESGDNKFSGWMRWAQRRAYPLWAVPVGFFVATAALFGLTMLCLFLFLPKSNVPTLTADIEKVPGVSSAQITSRADRVQTFEETVTVHLRSGTTVADPKALVSYLVRMAWAADGGEPEQVVVNVDGGASVNLFLAAVEDGWNGATGAGRTVEVDGQYLRPTLGAYPGAVPAAPLHAVTVAVG
ncbi:hypothetical protein [Frondihabitans cladoniiphilus]|uniref:GerMN domain-containing protein n=1 Tax=Frondihabitans cladoniiphilus TaxID=715785 RepID=A0ABP8VPR3_9MICO